MIECTKIKPGPLGAPGLESLQRLERCKTSGREYTGRRPFHATSAVETHNGQPRRAPLRGRLGVFCLNSETRGRGCRRRETVVGCAVQRHKVSSIVRPFTALSRGASVRERPGSVTAQARRGSPGSGIVPNFPGRTSARNLLHPASATTYRTDVLSESTSTEDEANRPQRYGLTSLPRCCG